MEKDINLRPFEVKDTEAVIALWVRVGLTRPWNDPYKDITRKLEEMAKGGHSWFWIAEKSGTIIAVAMAGYDGHRGSVNYLGVEPSAQNSGVGKQIMQRIEADLTEVGCPKLNLLVRNDNFGVQAFYEHIGYQRDATISLSKRLIADE